MAEDDQDELERLLEEVRDEASFLTFIAALGKDWDAEQSEERANPSPPFGPGARDWENGTIGAFLESAEAWGRVSRDQSAHTKNNPWARAAQILYAGKVYE